MRSEDVCRGDSNQDNREELWEVANARRGEGRRDATEKASVSAGYLEYYEMITSWQKS
jgi:hypothetical protein